jgi:hypothetical protein
VAGNNVLVSRARGAQFEPPTPLFKDLPYNGRSNGQIALGPDGLLYFQSTGDDLAASTSGLIYTSKPDGTEQKTLARGLKNAYAFAWNPQAGQMYATEIGDDFTVEVPEELNAIRRGGDYGWPLCYGKQQENGPRGGNRNICADTDVPLAIFPPHSTPTGLAFFDSRLIVALWGAQPPRLLSVDRKRQVEEFAAGSSARSRCGGAGCGLLVVDMDAGRSSGFPDEHLEGEMHYTTSQVDRLYYISWAGLRRALGRMARTLSFPRGTSSWHPCDAQRCTRPVGCAGSLQPPGLPAVFRRATGLRLWDLDAGRRDAGRRL